MKNIQKNSKRGWLRKDEIKYLLAQTRDVPKMMVEVERAMRFVYDKRIDWIDTHQEQFPTEKSKSDHLRNWVANYELSDAIFQLAVYPQSLKPGPATATPPIDFVRFNQFHEISTATPDEYERIKAEEERFGGRAHPQHKGQVLYEEGDSMFIVERFEASEMKRDTKKAPKIVDGRCQMHLRPGPILRTLQSPEEWTAAGNNSSSNLRVFAVDLNGHFSAGFSMDGVCVFINTTNNDYVRAEIMNWYFDLRFPPDTDTDTDTDTGELMKETITCTGSASVPETKTNVEENAPLNHDQMASSSPPSLGHRSSSDRGGGLRVPSSSVVSDHDLATMLSMGFLEEASKRSLEATGGELLSAMNILLAEVEHGGRVDE